MVVLVVDGQIAGLMHRSVLDRVADIAGRLGCDGAVGLRDLPASFGDAHLVRLRRELDQISAFADAALRTGWLLGEIAAAPGDQPVAVLDTQRGSLWADAVSGFELRGPNGVDRVTTLAEMPGCAQRVPLTRLIAPLSAAVEDARTLKVYERVLRIVAR